MKERDESYLTDTYRLIQLPGVGTTFLHFFQEARISKPEDLIGKDADELFAELCITKGETVDERVLCAFRCATYFMNTPAENRDPKLLLWWNWK